MEKVCMTSRVLSLPAFLAFNCVFMLVVLVAGLKICFLLAIYQERAAMAIDALKQICGILWPSYTLMNKLLLSGRFDAAESEIDRLNNEMDDLAN